MPVFTHESRYPHPRAEVFAWHQRPGAFVRLTPPGMATLLAGPTDGINVGSEAVLRMSHPIVAGLLPSVPVRGHGKGPVGITWRARHTAFVEGELFVDEQVSGPFASWRHEHAFADGPAGSTVVTDTVTYELPIGLPGGIDQALVNMQLNGMFRFREQQLRDDLALHAALGCEARHVAVTGASGLIGPQVAAVLGGGGHRVSRLVRRPTGAPDEIAWDPAAGVLDPAALRGVDAVVHLAGHSIAGRFSDRHKDAVLRSRVDGTRTLVASMLAAEDGPRTLVQASGIGVYGARRPDELLTEASAPGGGFLADVVRQWEGAAQPAVDAGLRVVFLRTGIVLSEAGGALMPQVPLFSLGVGGRLTKPDAWVSWIGLDDMARAYAFAVCREDLAGPVNAVAPHPVTARDFAETLGNVLHRPSLVPTPAFGPKLLLGREGADQIIETDQRVSASTLLDAGFRFAQPSLFGALRHALMR